MVSYQTKSNIFDQESKLRAPVMLDMHSDQLDFYDLRVPSHIIVDRIKAVKAHQKKPKPLMVLMGEEHTIPVTQLLQLAVLQGCVEAGLTPALGIEFPYNFLLASGCLPNHILQQKTIQAYLSIPTHHRDLLDFNFITSTIKDDTVQAQAAFCKAHDLSMMFNDAARHVNKDGIDVISSHDPVNVETALQIGLASPSTTLEELNIGDNDAMHLRNAIMTAHSLDQYQKHRPDVLIHMVGDHHVFGSDYDDLPYKTSMTALCRAAGFDVLPVTTFMDLDELPDETDLSHAFLIEGWDEAASFDTPMDKDCRPHIDMVLETSHMPVTDKPTPVERARRYNRFEEKLISKAQHGRHIQPKLYMPSKP